jgi:hypothetical protein
MHLGSRMLSYATSIAALSPFLPARLAACCHRLTAACPWLRAAERGGNPDVVRESQRRRYADVSLVDKVLELDLKWREGAATQPAAAA